jgi:hypothetical protein
VDGLGSAAYTTGEQVLKVAFGDVLIPAVGVVAGTVGAVSEGVMMGIRKFIYKGRVQCVNGQFVVTTSFQANNVAREAAKHDYICDESPKGDIQTSMLQGHFYYVCKASGTLINFANHAFELRDNVVYLKPEEIKKYLGDENAKCDDKNRFEVENKLKADLESLEVRRQSESYRKDAGAIQ